MPSKLSSLEKFGIISSFALSSCAFGLTLWQGAKMQQHNEMSVMPILNVGRRQSAGPNSVSLVIKNKGVGPALVKGCKATIQGKEFDHTNPQAWIAIVKNLIGENTHCEFGSLSRGAVLQPGEEVVLITIGESNQRSISIGQLVQAISAISVDVNYCSVYGKTISW